MTETREMLTVGEVALTLNCSKKLIYQLKDQGELSFHQIGRLIRIPKDSLQDYLQRTHRGRKT